MNEILAYTGCVILFLNVVLYCKGFSYHGEAFRVFTGYSLGILGIQIVVMLLSYKKINNIYLSHIYFLFQFVMLSWFYLKILKSEFHKKAIKIGFGICFLGIAIQYLYNPDLWFKFNLFEIFITSFLVIIYSTFQLYALLHEKKEFYYINLGILIYLFGSTVLFLAGNLVVKMSNKYNDIPWILNSFLYIVYQLFIFMEWKISFSKKTINAN